MMRMVKNKYQVIRKRMEGFKIVEFVLQDIRTGEVKNVTKEQLILLIGRNQITNITATINGREVVLKGKGIYLEDIPKEEIKTEYGIYKGVKDKWNKPQPFIIIETIQGRKGGLIRTNKRTGVVDILDFQTLFDNIVEYGRDSDFVKNLILDKYYPQNNIKVKVYISVNGSEQYHNLEKTVNIQITFKNGHDVSEIPVVNWTYLKLEDYDIYEPKSVNLLQRIESGSKCCSLWLQD